MKADSYYDEARDLWKKGKIPESNRTFTRALAYEEVLKTWKEENEQNP